MEGRTQRLSLSQPQQLVERRRQQSQPERKTTARSQYAVAYDLHNQDDLAASEIVPVCHC